MLAVHRLIIYSSGCKCVAFVDVGIGVSNSVVVWCA